DMGAGLAVRKALLFSGGAKVAATVATVAATSVVAATPPLRHDVVRVIGADAHPAGSKVKPAPRPAAKRVPAATPAAVVHLAPIVQRAPVVSSPAHVKRAKPVRTHVVRAERHVVVPAAHTPVRMSGPRSLPPRRR